MLKQDIPLVMLRTLTNPEQLAVDMFNGEPLRVGSLRHEA